LKKLYKFSAAAIVAAFFSVIAIFFSICDQIPPVFYNFKKSEIRLGKFMFLPIKVKPRKISNRTVETSNSLDSENKSYDADVTLLGIPIKSVKVNVTERKSVICGGTIFGIKIFTEGIMVVNASSVETENGEVNPASEAKIHKGDVITKAKNFLVSSNEDFAKIIEESGGNPVSIEFTRGNQTLNTSLKAAKEVKDGIFRAGIWVRDCSSAIGTMTFIDPEKKIFAGLGHGIRDIDTDETLPLSHGEISEVLIKRIIKPQNGTTGELRGIFTGKSIGKLKANKENGVYGTLNIDQNRSKLISVLLKQEVEIGNAKIVSTIENSDPAEYEIEILSVNFNRHDLAKNIKFRVTDEKLIEKTNGIIQGMSGSPIIQNNNLVGAVTHVSVSDSKTGYGIFAETMYDSNFFGDK
jgi:stage IV sporulation protein B